MDKKLLMAEEELQKKILAIATNSTETSSEIELARLANMPYDAELPVSDIISKVCKVVRAEKGEDYDYFPIGVETKTVYTIVNGAVTQVNVDPEAPNELTFYSYNGPEDYVYVEKLLEAKYDVIARSTKRIHESLNRKETKDVLDILIASAVAKSNTFAFSSGETKLTFAKLEEMVRSIEKYGTKLVLIAGSTVASDLRLMNYNEDKNQAVKVADLGISEVIKVPTFQYTHSTVQTVLDADKAILVAISDSEDEMPVHFVRRKVVDVFAGGDAKERIVMPTGPRIQVGSNPKWAYGIAIMEQYGVVQPNPYTVAVFKRDVVYS